MYASAEASVGVRCQFVTFLSEIIQGIQPKKHCKNTYLQVNDAVWHTRTLRRVIRTINVARALRAV